MQGNNLPRAFQSVVPGCNLVPNCQIGDPENSITHFCMKDYKCCKSNEQLVFNEIQTPARNQVKCAFGRLKARWAILTRSMDLSLKIIRTVV